MSSDLERRLAEALEARAGQVGPDDLVARELPAPDRGRGSRAVWVGLAAAACLAVVGAGVVVPRLLADPDAAQPPPADGEVSPPPDVGRDWEPVRGVRGEVDLDGDGTPDRVRLRGEPDPDFAGRTRLDVRLSGGGSAYGVVDLGTTLYSYSPRGVDLDGDGGEELLLVVDVDGTTTEPRVLDLRDDALVEAAVPAGEDTPLIAGAVRAGADRATGIRLDRVADWWVEDGSLRSSVSEGAYPALGMSWFVPDPYVAQVVSWRLEDGDLVPDRIEADACISRLEEERRPCEPGEQDGVPDLGPVSTASIGLGESSAVDGPVPATVSLSAGGGLLSVRVGGEVVVLGVDRGTRVLTRAVESVAQDGVGLALDTNDDGAPDELKTIAVERDGGLRAEGPFLLGSGTSWLSEDGTLFTRTGDDATGARVVQWTETRTGPVRVPLGTFCVPDGDVTAAERC